MWGIFLTTSNTFFQINTIMNKSTSDEAIRMAYIYSIGSFLSYVSIILYFKGIVDASYWLTLYYTIRNAIRLIDFEKTRKIMTDEEWL